MMKRLSTAVTGSPRDQMKSGLCFLEMRCWFMLYIFRRMQSIANILWYGRVPFLFPRRLHQICLRYWEWVLEYRQHIIARSLSDIRDQILQQSCLFPSPALLKFVDGQVEYEVEEVLDYWEVRGKRQYSAPMEEYSRSLVGMGV